MHCTGALQQPFKMAGKIYLRPIISPHRQPPTASYRATLQRLNRCSKIAIQALYRGLKAVYWGVQALYMRSTVLYNCSLVAYWHFKVNLQASNINRQAPCKGFTWAHRRSIVDLEVTYRHSTCTPYAQALYRRSRGAPQALYRHSEGDLQAIYRQSTGNLLAIKQHFTGALQVLHRYSTDTLQGP